MAVISPAQNVMALLDHMPKIADLAEPDARLAGAASTEDERAATVRRRFWASRSGGSPRSKRSRARHVRIQRPRLLTGRELLRHGEPVEALELWIATGVAKRRP